MNNKELQIQLAKKLAITQKEATEMLNAFVEGYTLQLEVYEDAQIPFLKMGAMVVKKKTQREMLNPSSKTMMLVPPKLSLSFKPSLALKNKVRALKLNDKEN